MSHEANAPYNDSNRAFLQAFLGRSTLTFEEAQPILAAIFSVHEGRECHPQDVTQEDLTSYIAAANTAISPLDMEIRFTQHQTTRQRIYALVNTTSDDLTQLATSHSPDEIAFVKRMLDAMFETHNTLRNEIMAITTMQAINLAKEHRPDSQATQSSRGLTQSEAEAVVDDLVDEGWFEKSRKGFLTLSARGLMELRGWLIDTYNDEEDEDDGGHVKIKTCEACKEIITMNFFRIQKATQCPKCKVEWTGSNYVGEKAVTTSEKYMQGQRRSGHSTNGRQSTQSIIEEASEDQDDEDVDDDGDGDDE
ncbi:MAG: hypothetical protein M1834_008236 [Cirrosporium novae-zelandiae]|nr:MAG: hypothetical protein M1834_008236 [Cirrosporium novae-zelandiae]